MKKTLTDVEKIDLVTLYLDGASIKELSKKYERAESSVRDLIKRRGIKLRPLSEVNRKFEIHEDFLMLLILMKKLIF
jgi:transposase